MLMWPVGNHMARTLILSCDFMCTQRLHCELPRLLVFATPETAKSPTLPNCKSSFCYHQL